LERKEEKKGEKINVRARESVIRTEVWLHGTKDMMEQTGETSSTVGGLKRKRQDDGINQGNARDTSVERNETGQGKRDNDRETEVKWAFSYGMV